MNAGAFAKPCEFVGTATWGWTGERITHMELETEAYALRDRDRAASVREPQAYRDRPDDVAWAAAKVAWLFSLARMECPPIKVGKENDDGRETSAMTTGESIRKLTCPWCGSRLQVTEVYFEKRPRTLLSCANFGSCHFREM